jgi:hypothetical protein
MTLASDIANDYLLFEGTQTVTLRIPPDGDAVSVAGVATFPLSYKQMAFLGGISPEAETISFSLARAACGATEPLNDGTITDANGVVWRIISKELKTLGTRWLCACVKTKDVDSCPFQPQSVANNGTGGGVLRLTWTNRNFADSGVAGRVEYSASADFSGATAVTVASISGASITFSQAGVAAGTYYVRVRHSNAKGNSPWSSSVTIVVTATAASFRVDFTQLASIGYVQQFTNGVKSGYAETKFFVDPTEISFVEPPAGFSVSAGGVDTDSVTFLADAAGAQAAFELFDSIPGYASLTTISLGD